MGSIQRSASVVQPPVSGFIAHSNGPVRMADFDADGRFRGWTGHAPRSSWDVVHNDHPMDLVRITRCRDSADPSPLDEAHIEMHVPIAFPVGAFAHPERAKMHRLWQQWRERKARESGMPIPKVNDIRAQLGLPPLEIC